MNINASLNDIEVQYICTYIIIIHLLPYTEKHSRGKTFTVFADFLSYRESFPVYVLQYQCVPIII